MHKILVVKPEGKRPLGRRRRRWEDNIKMDLQEVERGCADWTELSQDRDRWWALVSTVMNFRVPQNAGNFLISCKTSRFLKENSKERAATEAKLSDISTVNCY